MFSKVVTLSALLAAASAAYLDHGGAVSFQSIARHDQPAHYAAPVPRYTPPLVHYATHLAHYTAPGAHYVTPVTHYATSEFNYGEQNTNARHKYNSYDSRNNNAVHGYYSLAQSNVAPRKEYTANHMGFAAVLRSLALPLHPAPIYEEEENLY